MNPAKFIRMLDFKLILSSLALICSLQGISSSNAQSSSSQKINLFTPDYAEMIAAPVADWEKLLTGAGEFNGIQTAEVIFGFKDDKSATLDTIRVLIPATDNENIKTLELFVGDAPAGPFKSAAKIEPVNLYMAKTHGWQEFKIAPVTAKNFKFKFTTENGSWVKVYKDGDKAGLQILGTLNP